MGSAFAPAIRPLGGDWVIHRDGSDVRIAVRASSEQGTIDILRSDQPPSGAFLRVLPNGEGGELLFTLFFRTDSDDEAVAAQMATVEQELESARAM